FTATGPSADSIIKLRVENIGQLRNLCRVVGPVIGYPVNTEHELELAIVIHTPVIRSKCIDGVFVPVFLQSVHVVGGWPRSGIRFINEIVSRHGTRVGAGNYLTSLIYIYRIAIGIYPGH